MSNHTRTYELLLSVVHIDAIAQLIEEHLIDKYDQRREEFEKCTALAGSPYVRNSEHIRFGLLIWSGHYELCEKSTMHPNIGLHYACIANEADIARMMISRGGSNWDSMSQYYICTNRYTEITSLLMSDAHINNMRVSNRYVFAQSWLALGCKDSLLHIQERAKEIIKIGKADYNSEPVCFQCHKSVYDHPMEITPVCQM